MVEDVTIITNKERQNLLKSIRYPIEEPPAKLALGKRISNYVYKHANPFAYSTIILGFTSILGYGLIKFPTKETENFKEYLINKFEMVYNYPKNLYNEIGDETFVLTEGLQGKIEDARLYAQDNYEIIFPKISEDKALRQNDLSKNNTNKKVIRPDNQKELHPYNKLKKVLHLYKNKK